MWSKTVYFEFVAIYFLSFVPWPNPNVIKLLCSKDNARLVRKLIQIKWTPILDKYHVKLPIECPLHPFRDIFAPQQDAKKRERSSQWTCRLCGKSFFEEKFLDKHFENRHKDILNKAEDAVCFADFCDLMRCEIFITQDLNFINDDLYGNTDIEVWSDTSSSSISYSNHHHVTSSSSIAQGNVRQLLQARKRNILNIATAISGTNAQRISGVHYQSRQFCRDQNQEATQQTKDKNQHNENDGVSCENRSRQQEFSASASSTSDQENIKRTTKNESDDEQTMNAQQKLRYNCNPEELEKLKEKCEFLIRTCITGLLLEMSEYAFKEMEEELNKAICWYLTCERYWEDGPLEPKAFPWGLILVLVMVLSLGICFCYYIIWILFDSEETINNGNYNYQSLDPYNSGGTASNLSSTTAYNTRQRQKMFQRSTKIENPMVASGQMAVPNNSGLMGLDPSQDVIKEEKYPDDVIIQTSSEGSEHYIYVTYPPDLKRRLIEKYE